MGSSNNMGSYDNIGEASTCCTEGRKTKADGKDNDHAENTVCIKTCRKQVQTMTMPKILYI